MLPYAPSMLARALPVLPHAPPMLGRAPPRQLPSFVLAISFLQMRARPFIQLEADANPIAALPAVYIRPSPLSFSFIPSTVYRIFVVHLTNFHHSVYLATSYILALLLHQSPF